MRDDAAQVCRGAPKGVRPVCRWGCFGAQRDARGWSEEARRLGALLHLIAQSHMPTLAHLPICTLNPLCVLPCGASRCGEFHNHIGGHHA